MFMFEGYDIYNNMSSDRRQLEIILKGIDVTLMNGLIDILLCEPDQISRVTIASTIRSSKSYILFPDELIVKQCTDPQQIITLIKWLLAVDGDDINKMRLQLRRLMASHLGPYMDRAKCKEFIKKNDEIIFKKYGKDILSYELRYGQLFLMLKNANMCNKIISMISKNIDVSDLTIEDLNPEIFIPIREELALREKQVIAEKSSTIYSCPKCHQRKIKYTEHQTRASDEASTIFCTCLSCGETFRR